MHGPAVYKFIVLLLVSREINALNLLEGVGNGRKGISEETLTFEELLQPLKGQKQSQAETGKNAKTSKIDKVINLLESLQAQVDELKSSVESVQKMQEVLNETRKECNQQGMIRIKIVSVNHVQDLVSISLL